MSVTINNCWCHTVIWSVSRVSWLFVTILCTSVTEDVTLVHCHTKCDSLHTTDGTALETVDTDLLLSSLNWDEPCQWPWLINTQYN